MRRLANQQALSRREFFYASVRALPTLEERKTMTETHRSESAPRNRRKRSEIHLESLHKYGYMTIRFFHRFDHQTEPQEPTSFFCSFDPYACKFDLPIPYLVRQHPQILTNLVDDLTEEIETNPHLEIHEFNTLNGMIGQIVRFLATPDDSPAYPG